MKYLFFLGRNVDLSVAEVKSFLKKEGINLEVISVVKNGLLVSCDKRLENGIIEKFGGVISIGEVLASGNFKEIKKELENKFLYRVKNNKLNYVLFNFNGKDFDEISIFLKKRFREEKLKATEKNLTGTIKLQDGEIIPSVSSKLIDEQYFVFLDNFGRIVQKCDYEKIEKRDMEKPIRRNELSISPRLAKILINLCQVKERETLLDPFCGIGVVLQEALLQKIKVLGVDNDKKAIHGARLNLEWFNFSKNDYHLINKDSSKIKIQNVDAIVTEPDLGELQKKTPTLEKANQIVSGFEDLIISVINNLKRNVNGKIVFTAPLIKTTKKKVYCNFEKISELTGLKIVEGFPIHEFRKDSIVGRSILIMEKQ